jgi:hypothetical protein
MIRIAVFALLGPFAGYLVFIVLGGGFASHALEASVIVLPFAFIAGLLPALVTAAIDRALERLGAKRFQRYLLTAIAGYAAAYLLMIENIFEATPMVPFAASWGLVGGIPAILCSFIVDRIENPA